MHRALKISEKRSGPEHAETHKLRRMCHSLARRYAAEEAAALQAQSPPRRRAAAAPHGDGDGDGGGDGGGAEAASEWLRGKGLDLREWGLDDAAPADAGDGDDPAARVERIVAKLKSA